jgi:SAM-dependent methyltransferase
MANLAIYGDDKFDNIVSLFGSFSYCMDPYNAIRSMHRVAKENARLFLMTMGPKYPTHKKDVIDKHDIKTPIIFWTPAWISQELNPYFKIEKVVSLSFIPNHINFSGLSLSGLKRFLRLESFLLGKILTNQFFFHIMIGERR